MSQRKGRMAVLGVAAFAAVAAFAGVAQAGGNPSIPDNTVTGDDIKQESVLAGDHALNSIYSRHVLNGTLLPEDFSSAAKAALKGDKGDKGDSAIVSVTAVSNLTQRPDSGVHGNWALDSLTRTVAVTRQHAAEASKCGGGATSCYFYTASLADAGSFTTINGADSPQAGAPISGTVTGSVNGGTAIEFYASSGAPNPAGVPVNVVGNTHPTSTWVNAFFPAGTVVTESNLLNWSWTYSAPATCETWVNKFNGNTGDIKGVNAC